MRSLDCLSDIWLRNGEPNLALAAARENVILEPFREAGYRRLMHVHVALGNRGEAVRVYQTCRALLAKELSAEPSPETEAAYRDVVNDSDVK